MVKKREREVRERSEREMQQKLLASQWVIKGGDSVDVDNRIICLPDSSASLIVSSVYGTGRRSYGNFNPQLEALMQQAQKETEPPEAPEPISKNKDKKRRRKN